MQQTGGFSPSQRDSGRHARQSQADRDLGIQPRRIGLPATGPGGRPRRDAADTLYQRACGTRLVTRPLFGGCSTLCGKPAAGCSTRPKSPSRRRHARRAPRRRQRHSRWVASPRVSSISSRTARPSARSRRRKSAEAPAKRGAARTGAADRTPISLTSGFNTESDSQPEWTSRGAHGAVTHSTAPVAGHVAATGASGNAKPALGGWCPGFAAARRHARSARRTAAGDRRYGTSDGFGGWFSRW